MDAVSKNRDGVGWTAWVIKYTIKSRDSSESAGVERGRSAPALAFRQIL